MAEIEPGAEWGHPGVVPDDGVIVATDAEAAAVVTEARRTKQHPPVVGLTGGDLWRTLGGTPPPAGVDPAARLRSGPATEVRVDVGEALIDGRIRFFVAHLVLRRHRWWAGRAVVAMNAEFLGDWDLAPRGHPGDGRLERVAIDVGPAEWPKVRRRLPTGSHLPHPRISMRPTAAFHEETARPIGVHLDGVPVGRARRVAVRVEPAALRVVI